MKKALALVMAIAMVASMAAVSFAATGINVQKNGNDGGFVSINEGTFYLYNTNTEWFDPEDGADVEFGKTLYVSLHSESSANVVDADAVSGMKVAAKWTEGGAFVKGVEIVKKEGLYLVAINTTGSSLEPVDVSGTISLGGKTLVKTVNGNKIEKTKETVDVDFDVDFTLAYTEVDVSGETQNITGKKVYDFEENKIDVEEFKFTFGSTDVTAVTYVKNVDKVFYSFNTTANDELLDAYVDANLDFYNCNVAFRRTAEVTIPAAEGSYLYEVVDGELVAVDAEYDDWAEEFIFKTKKMGNYVVSDMELEVAEEVVATNPSTGAAA